MDEEGVTILAGVLLGLLLLFLLVVLWLAPYRIAKQRNHPKTEAILVCCVLSLVLWPLWLVAAIWAHTEPDPKRKAPARAPASPVRAALPTTFPDTPAPTLGSGRYRCIGIDRETGHDTTVVFHAATPANAKAKAELKGMIVTEVVPL